MDKNTKHIAMAAGVVAIVAAVYLFSKKDDASKDSTPLPPVTPPSPPQGVVAGNNYIVAAPFDALGLTTGMSRTFQVGDRISVIGKVGTVTTLTDPANPSSLYTTISNISGSFVSPS